MTSVISSRSAIAGRSADAPVALAALAAAPGELAGTAAAIGLERNLTVHPLRKEHRPRFRVVGVGRVAVAVEQQVISLARHDNPVIAGELVAPRIALECGRVEDDLPPLLRHQL